MVPEFALKTEEIEAIDRICELIVEEKDPARLKVLAHELDQRLRQEQERRARQTQAPKYPTAA